MKPYALIPIVLLCAACGSPKTPADSATPSTPPTASASATLVGRFAPRDECTELPGASGFRQRLVEAVQLRDADALAALADPRIKLDFGGGGGVAELKQQLATGDALWKSLEQVLTLGCAADPGSNMVIPWLFAQDLGSIDAGPALLVTGENVPVLADPRGSATRVTTISWDFVSAAKGLDRARPYTQVTLPLNRHGYVTTDKLRSVLDYRLLASRMSGQWRIDALVAGD
ncbi:MAG: hypothetical protein ABIT09_11960 [Croceibacterium sp.]